MNTIDETLMQQAVQYKQCTAEEQRILAQRAQCGDQTARDQLVLCNLRLVVATMKHFPQFMATNFEDVYQAGVSGLLTAIDHYDASRGAKFSSYATRWISQAIRMWIYDQNTIYLPRYLHDAKISVYQKMAQGYRGVPELAKQTKLRPSFVEHALQQLNVHVLSIDAELATGSFAEIVPDDYDLEADVEQDERSKARSAALQRLLALLTPRERQIIELRYGLTGQAEMTLENIAGQFGKSTTYIYKILNKAINKMRAAANMEETLAS